MIFRFLVRRGTPCRTCNCVLTILILRTVLREALGTIGTHFHPMKLSAHFHRIASSLAIWTVSMASALCVLALSVFLQWLVYDDWMHRTGPLQIVGSLLAAGFVFFLVMRWQMAIERHKEEMLRRFETIKWMNDRVRNALQTIDLLAFVSSEATGQVRDAVDTIESVLQEVLEEAHPGNSATRVREPSSAPSDTGRSQVEADP